MKRFAGWVALAVPAALAGGCDGGPAWGPVAPVCGNGWLEPGEQCDDGNEAGGDACSATCGQGYATDTWPADGRVDVLFVMDDSRSMCEEQAALREALPAFLDGLASDAAVDFHVGAIASSSSIVNDLGRLRNEPGFTSAQLCPGAPPPSDCVTGLPNPLPSIVTRDTVDPARTFGCIASVGAGGILPEAPLAAVERALSRSLLDDPTANGGFLREGALLAIVILTDEDDCSVCHGAEYGGTCGPLPEAERNLDCAIWRADVLTPASTFAGAMRARRLAAGRTFVASVIGLNAAGGSQGPIFPDPDPEHPDELFPICESGSARATPAPRLESYTRAFTPDAAVESLCDQDLTARLRELGSRIGAAATTTDWCLSHAPCPGLAADDYEAVREDGGIETPLGPGDFMVVEDVACGSGRRLELAEPLAAGATVRLTYAAVTMGPGCGG